MPSAEFNKSVLEVNLSDVRAFKDAYDIVLDNALHAPIGADAPQSASSFRAVENVARNWVYSGYYPQERVDHLLEKTGGVAHDLLNTIERFEKTLGVQKDAMRDVLRPLMAPQEYPEHILDDALEAQSKSAQEISDPVREEVGEFVPAT